MVKPKIKEILSQYHKKRIDDGELIPAAVLVPLFYARGEYHLLFTQRNRGLGSHQGQVCFPGGVRQEGDASLVDAALREAEEEIGLAREDIELYGELDDAATLTSGCRITPFVALIPHPYSFKINPREVEQVFSIPLSALKDERYFRQGHPAAPLWAAKDEGNFDQEYPTANGQPLPGYFYEYQGRVVWGATAYIVRQLMELLQQQGLWS